VHSLLSFETLLNYVLIKRLSSSSERKSKFLLFLEMILASLMLLIRLAFLTAALSLIASGLKHLNFV